MQVTETLTDGLQREFKIVVPADRIRGEIDDRLKELSTTLRLPGFRPGKVPMPLIKQRFGQSVLGEVLQRTVNDSSSTAMSERGLRPALTPKIDVKSFGEGSDLEYTMAVELLPEIAPMNFAELEIERPKVDLSDADVDKALQRVAEQQVRTEKLDETRPTVTGDLIIVDYAGSVDGKPFAGGTGTDMRIELGSGRMIPGFEDQIVGQAPGEEREITVTFPTDYPSREVAGKEARFKITLKELHRKLPVAIDEALAREMGVDDLESLKRLVREQMDRESQRMARMKLKRDLLDRLAEKHSFAVPKGMVDMEFDGIWRNVEAERKNGTDKTLAGKSEDELKAEFRTIAERRVRLGLLLAEVGRTHNIQVSQDELNRAVFEEARRYPGQERKVVEYFRNEPAALGQLRAPLFEDKVVDFIVELAKVTDKPMTTDELAAASTAD